MLSFTYCKQPLLYHRKFSLTQLSSHSYIIGSSPLTQCRRLLLCKRVLSPRYECICIYIKGHSLYLLWAAAPILILNNEGSHPFTSAHFQKAAMSGFIIRKGVMAKQFLLSQRNLWPEGWLHSLTRYDYCMISMKNLTWILTRRNQTSLYMTSVRSIELLLFLITQNRSTLQLSAPRWHEILPSPVQNKVFACLTTCFNVKKNIIQSIIKLDQPINPYGRVTHL